MMTTVRKVFILLSCTFLGLICGTLYLYSSYGPQFAKRLQYSATDSSFIALVGTLGIAVSGPIAGASVDKKGYTISMIIGGLSIVTGYLGMKKQFDSSYSNVFVSSCFIFLIGMGSTFLNSTSMKCCAVTFPSIRGVATSLPLALYGLSAMFFSVITSTLFPGDTSKFLGFLAYSSFGIFTICAPSIMMCDTDKLKKIISHKSTVSGTIELSNLGLNDYTITPQMSPRITLSRSTTIQHDKKNFSGLKLFTNGTFWQLFFITGSLAAMGQMYIYSVGYVVEALIEKNLKLPAEAAGETSRKIEKLLQQDQQLQVGLLSVANCIGRISSGILSDVVSQSFKKPRSLVLFIPSVGLTVAQYIGYNISDYENLSVASFLIGFFYGFTFCIMPIIIGDKFGMESFSFNWGIIGLAPIIPSVYFTSLFGKIYDSNSKFDEDAKFAHCTLGNACYNKIFRLTFGVSLITLLVVIYLNFGHRLFKRTTIVHSVHPN